MQIHIKTMQGETFTLDVATNSTVGSVKLKLARHVRVRPDQQRLIFNGGQIQDEWIVEDCGITDGSHVQMIPRLRGD